jgi:hypothetical protein
MSCKEPQPRLYQLSDGRFQILEGGDLAPLMVGYQYVLVESKFAEYVEVLDLPRLKVVDAVIYDPRRRQEILTHKQLRIEQQFSSDMIRDVDLDGERFLFMDGRSLFVSPLLKQRLEASPFEYLRFSEGLSEFAGQETQQVLTRDVRNARA